MFTYCPWESPAGGLGDDHRYFDAKKRKCVDAAYALCQDLCAYHPVLDTLADYCFEADCPPPIVAAPIGALHDSKNALAMTYGKWLARDLDWQFTIEIGQVVSVNRDFIRDGWFRLVHQPEFCGNIIAGRTYVLADDVYHMGGTLASLRGFILDKGGHVRCATTLAHGGFGQQFALEEPTRLRLEQALGGDLAAIVRKDLGYGIDGLTEPEAQFLLRCPSPDHLRAGIAGVR